MPKIRKITEILNKLDTIRSSGSFHKIVIYKDESGLLLNSKDEEILCFDNRKEMNAKLSELNNILKKKESEEWVY